MLTYQKTIVCACFAFFINLSLWAATPVEISLSKNAAPAVKSAAKDLLDGLKQIFPNDAFVLKDNSKNPRRIEIVVGGKGAAESFVIAKINNGKGIRITGADPLGAAYGVYALLELYGCGFYLTYDTSPTPEKGEWRLPPKFPDKGFADAPLCRERYGFNWHNFLSGCSGWSSEDWISWIDRCRKLRYNVIMVHAYGNNPMFTFEFKGIQKSAGYLSSTDKGRDWGTPHVNDVRRMIGGEHFDNAVFGSPAALVPDEQRIEAAQNMMKRVFAHAKSQGMKIAFQIDVDTPPFNSDEMMEKLPDEAKIKVGKSFRPRPDTPAGQEFYAAMMNGLLELYPEISSIVVCSRIDPQPGGFSVKDFPEQWKNEFETIAKNHQEMNLNQTRLAAYFWVGKVAKAFQDIAAEINRKDLAILQASWQFKAWLPYADACSPKSVAFLPLDYEVVKNQPEFDSPEGLQLVRKLTDSGRRIIPILWSHHDDGHYFGRTYTPYAAFASHLEKAGCESFGIIHWMLRPHDLYFKSHSVQTWQTTKDQTQEETCRRMALNLFGVEGEQSGGEYLSDWIRSAPMFGRETSDYMLDDWASEEPFSNDRQEAVQKSSARRRGLLDKINVSPNIPSASLHLAYWRGLEEFAADYCKDENLLRRSIAAINSGDPASAKSLLDRSNPASTIEKYAAYASQLGFLSGDKGALVLMNLKWYPVFVGMNQLLGRESYRINFAPTKHEPSAQGSGRRSFFFDVENKIWLVQGQRELRGEEWVCPDGRLMQTDGLTEAEKEIVRSGLRWSQRVKIPVVPVMRSYFASKNTYPQCSLPRKLRVYVADPSVKNSGDVEFDIVLDGAQVVKLGTIQPEPNVAQVFEFDIPSEFSGGIVVGIEPHKGQVTLCGLQLEIMNYE
jgi:hypothetical protein